MLFGLLQLSFWGYVVATLVLTHITIVAVTLYLHRYSAHRAIELHPAVKHFFRFWLWLTTGMITKVWTAVHRKHHAHCEKEDDPHSPIVLGLKKVLWTGAELYRCEGSHKETLEKFGKGCPDDWLERNVYTKHAANGIWLMLAIDILLFGLPGITIFAIQMMWIPFFAAGVINGVGHYVGYRNFECNDASTNISPIGILIGGEELHNNHHAYGRSAKFSMRWFEFDIGWMYIRILKFFGLCKVKFVPGKLTKVVEKNNIDDETVKAFLGNRLEILREYTYKVLLPIYQSEKDQTQDVKLLGRVKKLFVRAEALMSDKELEQVQTAMEGHTHLQTVYQYRQGLQSIWNATTASKQELIEQLSQWCKNAEAAGIDALEGFAQSLKTMVSKPAV